MGLILRTKTDDEKGKHVDFGSLLIHMNNKDLDSNGHASSNINSPAMGQSHHQFGNFMSVNREIDAKEYVVEKRGSGSQVQQEIKDASAFSKALRIYKA